MATIRDVSERAGVSVATVSRAFSDPNKLTDETLEKVKAAAEELKYKPNVLSQIFRTNSTNSIVVMIPDLSNAFFARVLSGVEQVASENGYSLLLSDTRDDGKIEEACVQMLESKRADGVIQLGSTPAEELLESVSSLTPFVHAIESGLDTAVPTVAIDNVLASQEITQYLLNMGHREIAVIAGVNDSAITQYRLDGIKKALNELNIPLPAERIVYGEYNLEGGAQGARTILEREEGASALICMSDEIAIGAMHEVKLAGFRVPDDISIVGFDNIPVSAFCDPPLTTVTQPAERIGEMATEMLVSILRGRTIAQKNGSLTADLVVRQSVRAVNS